MDLEADQPKDKDRQNGPATPDLKPQTSPKPRNEKIKMTAAGLTFSGATAFLSHLYRCSFVYKKLNYTSSEQAYHYTHAIFEIEPEIAKAIKATHNVHAIKDLAKNLPTSEAWQQIAPGTMWDIDDAKFCQNPDLMKRLLDTAPHKLIEASVCSKWGGGPAHLAPISMSKARSQVQIYVENN